MKTLQTYLSDSLIAASSVVTGTTSNFKEKINDIEEFTTKKPEISKKTEDNNNLTSQKIEINEELGFSIGIKSILFKNNLGNSYKCNYKISSNGPHIWGN